MVLWRVGGQMFMIFAQVLQNAEKFAKSALEEDSDSDEDMS